MAKIILKILGILFLAIFQVAIIVKFSILGAIPNLILILAIALAFKNRFQDALLVVIVGGVVLDLASPMRFGIYIFLFLVILSLIHFLLLKTIPTPNYSIAFLIFTGAFLFLDLTIFLLIKTWPSWVVLPQAIISGFWAVLIYRFIASEISPKEEIKFA